MERAARPPRPLTESPRMLRRRPTPNRAPHRQPSCLVEVEVDGAAERPEIALLSSIDGLVRCANAKDFDKTQEAAGMVREAAKVYLLDLLRQEAYEPAEQFNNALQAVQESIQARLEGHVSTSVELDRSVGALKQLISPPEVHGESLGAEAPAAAELPSPKAATPPPLADYCEEDEAPAIPRLPLARQSTLAIPDLANYRASRRDSVFTAMPAREDTRGFYRSSETSQSDDFNSARHDRSSCALSSSYPLRVLTVPRPVSTEGSASAKSSPRSRSDSASSTSSASSSSVASTSSSSSSSSSHSSARSSVLLTASNSPIVSPRVRRANSGPLPQLTAAQAQADCTRSQWVLVQRTLKWSTRLLILRGAGDVYLFKAAKSTKAELVMRVDKSTVVELVRTSNSNSLKVQTCLHKLVFCTPQGNEALAWKAVLEKAANSPPPP